MNFLQNLANESGIAISLLVIILIWSLVWKLLALWKSARNNHLAWFIVMAIVNTVGILPILYIFVFSKIDYKKLASKTKKKSAKKNKK